MTARDLLDRLQSAGCGVSVRRPRLAVTGTVPAELQRPLLVLATGVKALLIEPGACGG